MDSMRRRSGARPLVSICLFLLASSLPSVPAQEAGESVEAAPYAVTLESPTRQHFGRGPAGFRLVVANEGDAVGPAFSRAMLLSGKRFLMAGPPDAEGKAVGRWAAWAGSPPDPAEIRLHPGERLELPVLLEIPAPLRDRAEGGPLFVQWVGGGTFADARSNQVNVNMTVAKNPLVKLETTEGPIVLELWPDKAPNHVANFLSLAQKGFYDGLVFHRVIPNFMIQAGCPKGEGTGDAGYKIAAEFNDAEFRKGVVGMARAGHPDSAGSQFFICVADAPHLSGQYTAFGRTLEGQDVADAISAKPRNSQDRPNDDIVITKVTVELPEGYTVPEVQTAQ